MGRDKCRKMGGLFNWVDGYTLVDKLLLAIKKLSKFNDMAAWFLFVRDTNKF